MNQTREECINEVGNLLKRSKAHDNGFMNTELEITHLESKRTAKERLSIIHEETPNRLQHSRECFSENDCRAGKTQGKNLPSRVAKGSFAKTLDSVDVTVHNCFARNVNVLIGAPRVPLGNHTTRKSLFQAGNKEKDMTSAKAFFPDFFPRQLVQDSYDCLQARPTLEQIFSGQIKS